MQFALPKHIQDIISTYQVLGFIPLDKLLHFFVGMLITIILRYKNVRMVYVVSIIAIIQTYKEINDHFVLNSTWEEHLYDTAATFIYPALIWIVLKIKSDNKNRI